MGLQTPAYCEPLDGSMLLCDLCVRLRYSVPDTEQMCVHRSGQSQVPETSGKEQSRVKRCLLALGVAPGRVLGGAAHGVWWGPGDLPTRVTSLQVSDLPAAQLRRGWGLHQAGGQAGSLEGKMEMRARLRSLD